MSHFIREEHANRELALRARRISASRAAAILGKSRWGSPYSVWCEMTGRLPDSEDNPIRFRVGHALEALIGELYEEHTRREVFYEPQNQIQVHPIYPYITCTLDFTVCDYFRNNGHDKGCLNAKTAISYKAEEWETGCPIEYWIQAQHELVVTGRKWASLAVLIGNHTFRWIDIDRDDDFINNAMLPRYHQFWACVRNDIEPPADWRPATTEALSEVYPHENGTTVELPAAFAEWDSALVEATNGAEHAAGCAEGCKNYIKQFMGEAETAILPGVARYTWKVQKTAGGGLARIFRRTAIK